MPKNKKTMIIIMVILTLVLIILASTLLNSRNKNDPTNDQNPKTMTTDQADLFASTRFQNNRAKKVECEIIITKQDLKAKVLVDYEKHNGYGNFTDKTQKGFIAWTPNRIAVNMKDENDLNEWWSRELDKEQSLDSFLLALYGLSSDRPDNPQLLRQSDAKYFGKEIINGVKTSKFSGPSKAAANANSKTTGKTRFWIDNKGFLRKFQMFQTDSKTQKVIAKPYANCVPASGKNLPTIVDKIFPSGAMNNNNTLVEPKGSVSPSPKTKKKGTKK